MQGLSCIFFLYNDRDVEVRIPYASEPAACAVASSTNTPFVLLSIGIIMQLSRKVQDN